MKDKAMQVGELAELTELARKIRTTYERMMISRGVMANSRECLQGTLQRIQASRDLIRKTDEFVERASPGAR
jgi:hypothetical protein